MADLRFNDIAGTYGAVRPVYPDSVYDAILAAGERKSFAVAADVGCGAGASLEGLQNIADSIIGIEPAPRMRAIAARTIEKTEGCRLRSSSLKLPEAASIRTCSTVSLPAVPQDRALHSGTDARRASIAGRRTRPRSLSASTRSERSRDSTTSGGFRKPRSQRA